MSEQRKPVAKVPGVKIAPQANAGDLAAKVAELSSQHEQLVASLFDSQQRMAQMARSVWKLQEQERRKLAIELHDGIGQLLSALKNELVLAHDDAKPNDELSKRIDYCIDLTSQALKDTREMSRLLRPQVLDDLGLEAALQWFSRIRRERGKIVVRVVCTGLDQRLHPERETLVFRIVQESVNNAEKHSGAEEVLVRVDADSEGIQVVIADDGAGFNPDQAERAYRDGSGGVGLAGMRDRVELFGGRFAISSEPGAGTTIEMWIKNND